MMSKFEYNGTTITVRPRTGMDDSLKQMVLYDVGKVVLKARGYDISGDYPRTLDKLIVTFCNWYTVSAIEGGDVPSVKLVSAKPEAIVAAFNAWEDACLDDPSLWALWQEAYEKANQESFLANE